MAPLTLEGDTLGQKHRSLNKLVKDAKSNDQQWELTKINYEDNDVENLMKIDIANRNKNVDYILEVFKCDDMLYIARAIKRSTWLITDQQYANVINPQYLEAELFPYMHTKAINKLMLHIRLNLKEEKRVDEFYKYMAEHKPKEAVKWLQNCSLDLVENVLKKESQFPLNLYKRLCRRSFGLIKYCANIEYSSTTALEAILFLLSSHTEEFLDYLDTVESYVIPTVPKTPTEIIMKKCPHRIFNKFERYASSIHLPTVAKYLKQDEIKEFILKYIKNPELQYIFRDQDTLKHFVKRIPESDRFEFIKAVFIDKYEKTPSHKFEESVAYCSSALDDYTNTSSDTYYRWYQFAPFNVAFMDLKKIIRNESSPSERTAMFIVMLNAAKRNPQNLQTVLKYYHDRHMNEAFKFKINFVNHVISSKLAHKFDSKAWNILNQLFHSLEAYNESSNNVQTCLKPIILYNVLNNQKVPEIVEKNFNFDTFKNIKAKLNQEEQNKMFTYLYNYITTKLEKENLSNPSEIKEHISLLTSVLNLLSDWNKDIQEFPVILKKIKEIVKIKKDKASKPNLFSLYNFNKSWRRHMFEESLDMYVSKETCLNVLKHQPALLLSHMSDLFTLHTNNTINMCRIFTKLRIYFPHNLTQPWIDKYYGHLDDNTGHNALFQGLFTLLPQKRVIDIAKAYVPKDTKIKWGEVDQNQINICKNVAKNLYLARPSAPLDVILLYAKGDYLQYAAPSLNAVLHNLSRKQSREYVSKLLEAPVSLQKYGIHLAFAKLGSEELRPLFLNIWNTTKNSTIRAVLFIHSHSTLCKVKDPAEAKKVWELMSTFIDNLSNDENKLIYNKMGKVKNIHLSVRGEYYMKCYKFLKSLPAKTNSESTFNELTRCAPMLMDSLNPEFVIDIMLNNLIDRFCNKKDALVDILSSFLLHVSSEEEQMKRYEKTLGPLLDNISRLWTTVVDNEYLVKDNFNKLTKSLSWRFKVLTLTSKINYSPTNLFGTIQNKLKEAIPAPENYLFFTYWKIAEIYVRIIDENRSLVNNIGLDKISDIDFTNEWMGSDAKNIWSQINVQIAPTFGSMLAKLLKDDVANYFPSIYVVFGQALEEFCCNVLDRDTTMECVMFKQMLKDKDFIPSYLVVCDKIPKYFREQDKTAGLEMRKMLSTHPSMEVQMHYFKKFWSEPEDAKPEGARPLIMQESIMQYSDEGMVED